MNSGINQSMGVAEWGLLLTLSVLWGGSFFFVGVAVSELPPLTIVLLRVAIASLVLWLVVFALKVPLPPDVTAWWSLAIMGFLNNVIPFTLIVWGQTHIESGLASILNATTPLFGVLLAGLLLSDERLTRLKLAGVFIGFVGTVVMIGPVALGGQSIETLAQLAILGAALAYGFAGVFGRSFKRQGLHPIATAAGQVTASTVLLIPLVLVIDEPFSLPAPGLDVWLSIVALAVFSTALAYIIYFRLLASSGAVNLLLVTFLIPVSAIFLGYLVLGERLSPNHFVGMLLIGVGLVAIDGRLLSRKSASRVN